MQYAHGKFLALKSQSKINLDFNICFCLKQTDDNIQRKQLFSSQCLESTPFYLLAVTLATMHFQMIMDITKLATENQKCDTLLTLDHTPVLFV